MIHRRKAPSYITKHSYMHQKHHQTVKIQPRCSVDAALEFNFQCKHSFMMMRRRNAPNYITKHSYMHQKHSQNAEIQPRCSVDAALEFQDQCRHTFRGSHSCKVHHSIHEQPHMSHSIEKTRVYSKNVPRNTKKPKNKAFLPKLGNQFSKLNANTD